MNPTIPQHSHKHLYIVIVLLIIFSILFFTYKSNPNELAPIPGVDETPLGLKQIVLSAEQLAAKKATFNDPMLTKTSTLTKTEQQQKAATLSDPKMTEALPMSAEQIKAKQESFNQ